MTPVGSETNDTATTTAIDFRKRLQHFVLPILSTCPSITCFFVFYDARDYSRTTRKC